MYDFNKSQLMTGGEASVYFQSLILFILVYLVYN